MKTPVYQPINGKASIKCPDCQTKLSPDLVPHLVNGTDVYCENCGFLFTGISQQGEVKPLDEKHKETNNQPQVNLSKREDQWVEWKKEWGNIKDLVLINWKKISKEIKDSTSQVFSEIHDSIKSDNKVTAEYNQKDADNLHFKHLVDSPFTGATTRENNHPQPTQPPQLVRKKANSIAKLSRAIDILVRFTPIYYAFIFIITIINFGVTVSTGNPEFLTIFGSFAAEIFIMNLDYQTFLPQERENRIPHAGLSLIIVGLLGLRGNGISLLILARGILHVIKFAQTPKDLGRRNPALCSNSQQNPIWIRESIIAFIPYIQKLVMIYFISGLFTTIKGFVNNETGYGIFSLLVSIVCLILYYGHLQPELIKNQENTPVNTAIFFVVVGALSSSNGMGIPLIFMAILLFIYADAKKYLSIKFNQDKDITEYRFHLVPSATPVSIAGNIQNPGQNVRKFDPETGRRTDLNVAPPKMEQPKVILPIIKTENFPIQEEPSGLKDEGEISTSERIFNLLSPQNRAIFLSLPLTDQERDEIAKSLVYLDESQQKRYLDELSALNPNAGASIEQYIHRITVLPLPKDQHDFLVEQLHYLPEDNFEEFVWFLEQTVKTTP